MLITGGYVSNPVALSARLTGKPLFIVEPNSVAGATGRFYSRRAELVFTTFPEVAKLRTRKVLRTGNPSIFKDAAPRKEAAAYFGFPENARFIGVTGGSQGAKVINDTLVRALPALAERGLGVVWSAGAVDYDRLEQNGTLSDLASKYPAVKVYRFIDRMDYLLSACELIVNRAGVTTISEMIHFGVPSVLIPIKNSPDNHQYLNAKYLSDGGGSVLLEEDGLDAESFAGAVDRALANREAMRRALLKLKPDAPAKKIADTVILRLGQDGV